MIRKNENTLILVHYKDHLKPAGSRHIVSSSTRKSETNLHTLVELVDVSLIN